MPCATSATQPPERFYLAGPRLTLDPRVHAYRSDIADVDLAGRLFAPYYAQPVPRMVTATAAMLRIAPTVDAVAVSQLVTGEGFDVLDIASGWTWGRCAHDGYVGYLPEEALGDTVAATHRVTAVTAPVFAAPDIKAPVRRMLSIGAYVAGAIEGQFVATDDGHLHVRHVARLDEAAPDPVAVAERMIGLPYLWGGRGAGGVDCSGLVQVALGLAGVDAPRDSDQQHAALGVSLDEGAPLERGDLVFFPGHVGIMQNAARLLHANAYWMTTMTEPLADVVARGAPILARRRIGP